MWSVAPLWTQYSMCSWSAVLNSDHGVVYNELGSSIKNMDLKLRAEIFSRHPAMQWTKHSFFGVLLTYMRMFLVACVSWHSWVHLWSCFVMVSVTSCWDCSGSQFRATSRKQNVQYNVSWSKPKTIVNFYAVIISCKSSSRISIVIGDKMKSYNI